MNYVLPGTIRTEENGQVVLTNPTTGNRILFSKDGDLDVFCIELPGNKEHGSDRAAGIYNFEEVRRIYAERWLNKVAVDIGIGFHPDTSADAYEPPLPDGLRGEYDDMLDLVFEVIDDPYAFSMRAWEHAGLVSPSVGL